MSKELGNVAQLVSLQSVDSVVLLLEHLLIRSDVLAVNHAEPLREQQQQQQSGNSNNNNILLFSLIN